MKKYIVCMLLVPFLLLVTYFLFFTGNDNESSTVHYTETANNVAINRVSNSSRKPESRTDAAAVSNAGTSTVVFPGGHNEELPTKNDGINDSASSGGEPVMDSETIIVPNDYEIVIPDGTSLDITAGTIIEKAATGTIIHVGPGGALMARIDGTVLTFPPDSEMEFHAIHSVMDFLDSDLKADVTNADGGGSSGGCKVSLNGTFLILLLHAVFAKSDRRC